MIGNLQKGLIIPLF